MSFRPVKSETLAQPTLEGAGVHLHRAFGFHNPSAFDPFLLFDDFRNEDPEKFKAGFPWHPHRGHRDHHLRPLRHRRSRRTRWATKAASAPAISSG